MKFYQKNIPGPGGKFKDAVASIGHSLTWGRKDDAFVIGSPNFPLGNPRGTRITHSGFKDQRYGGFGDILRFGKVYGREAQQITQNKRVLMNPLKGRGKGDTAFREKLKKKVKDTEQGTPALYLGWSVITGKIRKIGYLYRSRTLK